MKTDKIDLLRVIGDIEETYIQEAFPEKATKFGNKNKGHLMVAAALLFLLLCATIYQFIGSGSGDDLSRDAQQQIAEEIRKIEQEFLIEPKLFAENDIIDSDNPSAPDVTPEKGEHNDYTTHLQEPTDKVIENAKKKDEMQKEVSADDVKESIYNKLLSKQLWRDFTYDTGYITNVDSTAERVWFVFINDTNEIMIKISKITDTKNYAERLVTASDISKYDICNYDIPYSQTIPKELWYSMQSPIFAIAELNKEVIDYRTVIHKESSEKYISIGLAVEIDGYVIDYALKGEAFNDICQTLIP